LTLQNSYEWLNLTLLPGGSSPAVYQGTTCQEVYRFGRKLLL